jgi:two-component system chemotaxis response regulator CheY
MSSKILIVDDASFIRKQLIHEVEQLGHIVVGEGKNGLDAIDLFKKHSPDIVFIDINMPILDGLHAIQAILKIDPKAQIVVISSVSAKENLKELANNGVVGFVKKPFTIEDIRRAIEDVNGGKGD